MSVRPACRVLDVSTGLAGLYAGQLLARNGFDVSRVTIADSEATGPIVFDGPASERESSYRRSLDDGVRLVEPSVSDLPSLLDEADVLLTTFAPSAGRRLGCDPDELRRTRPDLLIVSVTPFGLASSRAEELATEHTLFAQAGGMFVTGRPDGPPLSPNLPIASILGGIYAATAVLLRRLGQARGGMVDLALVEILVANTERVLSWYSYLEAVPHRGAGSGRLEQASGGGFLRAEDGHFYVFSGYQWFDKVAQLVGRPELVAGEGSDRTAGAADADRIVSEAIASLPVAELTRRAQELRMPSGPVNTVASLMADVQMVHRSAFPNDDGRLTVREPYRFLDGPAAAAGEDPPTGSPDPWGPSGGPSDLPLDGVRVLDLSHAFAGPTSSRMLAEAGADVLKIESVTRLDLLARGMLPFGNDTTGDWWDRSAYYGERNLGKRSLTLDMAEQAGRDLFLDLLGAADVVVANFTPRVLHGWGIGPEVMLQRNPRVVVLMMTGFGMDGPKADNPALAGTMEAASGFASLVRGDESEPPSSLGFNFGDMVAGVTGASAVLFALEQRRSTGRGGIIDFACAEAPLPFLAPHLHQLHESGAAPRARDDLVHAGRHVLIETSDKPERQRWVLAYLPPGSDQRLVSGDAVLDLVDRPDGLSSSLDRAAVLAGLHERGIVAVPVADAEDLWFDPDHRQRGLFAFATRHSVSTLPYARSLPGLWDGAPLAPEPRPIPTLGDANWSVLGRGLGTTPERFAVLERDGITGSRPLGRLPKTFQVPLDLDALEAKGLIRPVEGARSRLLSSFDP